MKANLKNEKFFIKLIKQGKLKVTKSGKAINLISCREIAKESFSSYRKISWKCTKTNKIKQIQLHRLVWSYFKGIPDDENYQINHLDGDKHNCKLSNLELTDNSGNVKHALANGLIIPIKGQQKPNSKFKDKTVAILRKKFATRKINISYITEKYTVSGTTVVSMLTGKTYKHINSGYEEKCRILIAANPQNRRRAGSLEA